MHIALPCDAVVFGSDYQSKGPNTAFSRQEELEAQLRGLTAKQDSEDSEEEQSSATPAAAAAAASHHPQESRTDQQSSQDIPVAKPVEPTAQLQQRGPKVTEVQKCVRQLTTSAENDDGEQWRRFCHRLNFLCETCKF